MAEMILPGTYIDVRPEGLIELDDWLAPYRQMWQTSLDRLEAHVTTRGETND